MQQAPQDERVAGAMPKAGDQHGQDGRHGQQGEKGGDGGVTATEYGLAACGAAAGEAQCQGVVDIRGEEAGEADMQRSQKSMMLGALSGELKFNGSLIPKNRASPSAMSV